ncbi:uncharacterized protein L969DRAFT_446761 [Mixia osmundae IAM 14324]|uniref:arginyltransferase n=1 Tax=Mixia osmundae (strain CBS 9802 / IAM 14324 / JCM 22182 / KY 12970) TaxID=764103 RepID=G7E3N7_MIXOS|nr:uncharacterized protein L969DRAFT_446761 [Mixia osmundae IAM 14324]KEI39430.1 hypothetical protein L969DRAFT_446761 [Mixia osmundae IAM 14324]GAA97447.1 hypothetical protein E5Q_04126 [Mixia osmundae IAM 14324]
MSPVGTYEGDREASDVYMSILSPVGYKSSSHCGYCGSEDGKNCSRSYGIWAHTLSPWLYQDLCDRGWRRSGSYVYKPDMARTCCLQYTIRLDVGAFTPTKSQRQILKRFNSFVRRGGKEGSKGFGPRDFAARPVAKQPPMSKDKQKVNPFNFVDTIHAAETSGQDGLAHEFTVTTELASFTEEKFELYNRYQISVHDDDERSPQGFKRFLCDTPIRPCASGHSQQQYGSYHQLYRLDEKLIGLAVLDVLPRSVSSVYFIWDPDFAGLSLGKVSALREIAWVRQLRAAGMLHCQYYYMGYYIHTCPKMRYKADYEPSSLLDPSTLNWYHYTHCRSILDRDPRAVTFEDQATASLSRSAGIDVDSDDEEDMPSDPVPPGMLSRSEALHHLPDLVVFDGGRGKVHRPFAIGGKAHPSTSEATDLLQSLGPKFAIDRICALLSSA